MIAAAAIGILTLSTIPGWIGSLRGESVLNAAARQWTIGDTSVLPGMIADFVGILLLATLYRLADDGSSGSGIAVWRLLRSLTKIAVIAGGIVAIGGLIGLAATPWVWMDVVTPHHGTLAIDLEGHLGVRRAFCGLAGDSNPWDEYARQRRLALTVGPRRTLSGPCCDGESGCQV